MRPLLSELRRRNVLRVAALYLVCAWLIAQVTDVVGGLAGLPPSVGQTILVILALGFPVAVVLAWLFEWTPEGLRRDHDDDAATAAPVAGRRRIDVVLLALMTVALSYFVTTHDWSGVPVPAQASVAVLPFDDRGAAPDELFFADGMHDDLLTQLARVSSLVVVSRSSVLKYRDTALSVPQIATELGVAAVLEGAVQRAGDRVRINLRLVDAATDRPLWAETLDRSLTAENVFAIQSEIASRIAESLEARLQPAERERIESVPTKNLDAYYAYHLGRRDYALRTAEGFAGAQRHFEQAIQLDPEFALAHAGLADTLALASEWSETPRPDLLANAERSARRAVELDPQLGEAYSSLGLVQRIRGESPDVYARNLQRAVELAPGAADAHKWYANFLAEHDRTEEALAHLDRAVQIDPLSAILHVNRGESFFRLGRESEAVASWRRALAINPNLVPALASVLNISDMAERLSVYSEALARQRSDAAAPLYFVLSYLELDDPVRAEAWYRYTVEQAGRDVLSDIARMNIGQYLRRWDDVDEAATSVFRYETGEIPIPSRLLALRDLRRGDPASARSRYARKYPEFFGPNPPAEARYDLAVDIALVLSLVGERAQAERLIDGVLALRWNDRAILRRIGAAQARALSLRGDADGALAMLEALVASGWSSRWWFYFEHDAAFDALRTNARFVALADGLRSRMAQQRDIVAALEREGLIAVPAAAMANAGSPGAAVSP